MKIRTKEDLCLLCLQNKSDKTGSHYTPSGIIKRVIGERNYEEIYSIKPHSATTTQFFGRSNLLNTNPTIKKAEHVEDYIFCTDCEKKLGLIEGECNKLLLDLTDLLVNGKLSIYRTSKRNKFFTSRNPDKNILALFFYSIIWRQSIQQLIQSDSIFISVEFQELLRKIIYSGINKSLKEIKESMELVNYPKIIILTSYHKDDDTNNFINPNPNPSNPELFFIGPYDILIFHNPNPSKDFESKTGLITSLIDEELVINHFNQSIIGIINNTAWKKVNQKLLKDVTDKYLHTLTTRLSNIKGWPYEYSGQILHITARRFLPQYPNNYIQCLSSAMTTLLH